MNTLTDNGFFKTRNKNAEPSFTINGVVWTPSIIKQKTASNDAAAKAALLRIYSYQTKEEQATGHTHEYNNKGFNSNDAEILSSFALQLETKGWLSPKQMTIVKKKISKYSNQLFDHIIEPLEKQIRASARNNTVVTNKDVRNLLRFDNYLEKLAEIANKGFLTIDSLKDILPAELINKGLNSMQRMKGL